MAAIKDPINVLDRIIENTIPEDYFAMVSPDLLQKHLLTPSPTNQIFLIGIQPLRQEV
ncbi:MAG TPA: hypothetical protein VJ302_00830 [Blastocatellia bacterium]|nr:hypothetical protein [Blastocatellia bacterium]